MAGTRNPYIHDLNPPDARCGGLGGRATVEGASKLNARVPLAWVLTVVGVGLLVAVPFLLLPYLDTGLTFLLAALVALPLLAQGFISVALLRQRETLLAFLDRLGPDTRIESSKALTLYSYFIWVRTKRDGVEHRFGYGYWPLRLRKPPHVKMVWPTTRKGISLQNRNRFNQFSAKYNTIEFTYLKSWHVSLFTYPTRDETWWFKLYLFGGAKAAPEHLMECFEICVDTKEKLTRENPAF